MSDNKDNNSDYYDISGVGRENSSDSYILPEEELSDPLTGVGTELDASSADYASASEDPASYSLADEGGMVEYDLTEDLEEESEEDDEEEEEEEEEEDTEDPAPEESHPHALLLMFRTLLTPVDGWKALKRSHILPEKFASECFYPLVAFASVSEFGVLLYGAHVPLQNLIISALKIFISFFLGYFLVLLCGRIFIKSGRVVFDQPFGRVFVMNSLSSLAVFYSLLNFLPMLEPVLVFLPLWTIYAVCRGVRFLRFPPDSETVSTCLICLLIVGMPIVVGWIFSFVFSSM